MRAGCSENNKTSVRIEQSDYVIMNVG